MLKAIFTLDYEIHGNGEGDPYALMVEPTRRMMDLFEQYGAKLTIMADVAEILKFKEYREGTGRDDFHYGAIADQLREAIQRGHDVQLHLHSSYFNATFNGNRWEQDWSEYNFAELPFKRLNQMVRSGKEYLENLLKPVDRRYECVAFRAANWAVSPSRNVVRALINNGIRVETSVFKYGQREGIVSFDYSNAHSNLVPWTVDEDDICQQKDGGKLTEAPIYCERRWIGAFLTPNRVRRLLMSRRHPIARKSCDGPGVRTSLPLARKILRKLFLLTRNRPWKADFNQCTGWQLIKALKRAAQIHDPKGNKVLPFVLIGHSKLFGRLNELSLQPFLSFVRDHPARFGFATLASYDGAVIPESQLGRSLQPIEL
jgi:hypothetical protein